MNKKEAEDVLPCPFCGHKEVSLFISGKTSKIYCPYCGCTHSLNLNKGDVVGVARKRELLLSRWNCRVGYKRAL